MYWSVEDIWLMILFFCYCVVCRCITLFELFSWKLQWFYLLYVEQPVLFVKMHLIWNCKENLPFFDIWPIVHMEARMRNITTTLHSLLNKPAKAKAIIICTAVKANYWASAWVQNSFVTHLKWSVLQFKWLFTFRYLFIYTGIAIGKCWSHLICSNIY